jgi:protein-tyrosine phosphatase
MSGGLVEREFGTFRGLVRTALAYLMWLLGPYREYGEVDWTRVNRIVFVCLGNICRSPYAHYRCLAMECPLPVASFGLSTSTGVAANATAAEVALSRGIDLSGHSATDLADFTILDGDLLLVMEDRHIDALAPAVMGRNVQIGLLGLWYRPSFALLYDPFSLSPAYFASCFRRIDAALARVVAQAKAGNKVGDGRLAPQDRSADLAHHR